MAWSKPAGVLHVAALEQETNLSLADVLRSQL